MHPSSLATENAKAQRRLIETAQELSALTGIDVVIPKAPQQGDPHLVRVHELKQRQALADFMDSLAAQLTAKTLAPKPAKVKAKE